MTEKRFRVQEHCLRSSYGIEAENWLVTNDNHSVALNDKAEAHMVANMCNDVIDVLNALHEENEELKQFKDKTFDLLDKEITQNEEAIAIFEKKGSDVGALGFYTNMLKILLKELNVDD